MFKKIDVYHVNHVDETIQNPWVFNSQERLPVTGIDFQTYFCRKLSICTLYSIYRWPYRNGIIISVLIKPCLPNMDQ